jgi:hypothetical protein
MGRPRWVKPENCLWQGPKCLRRYVPLKDIYPANKKLFCDILKISNAGAADLVREAKCFQNGDKLQDIKDLFLEMEKILQDDESETAFRALFWSAIFPVRNVAAETGYNQLMRHDPLTPHWFIADRVHLEESFKGKVPLLAFTVEDVSRMTRLLRKLGVEGRKLTKAAKSIPTTQGNATPDRAYKESLLVKIDFILR